MNGKHFHTTNNNLAFLVSVLMVGAVILSACMSAPISAPAVVEQSPKVLSAPAKAPIASGASEATINVATDAKLGKILVGDNGMTLYIYTIDGPNQSNCGPDCMSGWPPLLTQGNPKLGEGVNASLVGSASLSDGSKIVTYNKMPLYYFVGDTKAGDTTGQSVGNVWYVVSADGKPVDVDASSAAPISSAVAAPAVTVAPVSTAIVTPTVTTAPTQVTSTTFTEPTINIFPDSKLGKFLVGDQGMTLYILTKDAPDQSNCNAACLQKWHPLQTQGAPTLGAGLDATMFGTASLPDGTKILTFNNRPLYYFVGDSKAGDTKGEAVAGVWFVISPLGKLVPSPAPMPTPKPMKESGGGYNY